MLTVAINGHLVFYSAFVKTFFQSLVFLFCIPVCIYYAFANITFIAYIYMHSYCANMYNHVSRTRVCIQAYMDVCVGTSFIESKRSVALKPMITL